MFVIGINLLYTSDGGTLGGWGDWKIEIMRSSVNSGGRRPPCLPPYYTAVG